jgi:hypothetical protein
MSAPNALHVVEGGDHSLIVSKTELKTRGVSQETIDTGVGAAISKFLAC